MNVIEIQRNGRNVFVRKVLISDLDKSKLSNKFLSHNLPDDTWVYVKCYEDGSFDLRGKKEEYRLLMEDKF